MISSSMKLFPILVACCLASSSEGGVFNMNGMKKGEQEERACVNPGTLESVNAQLAEAHEVRDRLMDEKKSMENLLHSETKGRADEVKEWKQKVENLEAAHSTHLAQLDEHKSAHENLQNEHRAVQEKLTELIAAKSTLEGEAKAHQAMLEKMEKKYESKLSESEATKTQYLESSLQEEVDKVVNEKEAEWNKRLESLTAEKEAALEALEKRLSEQHESFSSEKEQIESELDRKAGEIEEKWQESFESLKEEHAKSIQNAETAAKKALDDLKTKTEADTKDALDTMRMSYENQRETMQEQIDRLTKYESMYDEARKDAEYWEVRFARRNYVNITQIKTDAVDTATRASNVASAKYAEAKQLANDHYVAASDHVQKKRAVIEEVATPHVNYALEMYNEYIREHVDNAIAAAKPHYDEHVSPLVVEARLQYNRFVAEGKDASEKTFAEMVNQLTQACPSIKENLLKAPESLQESAEQVCADPSDSVERFLWTALCIVALIFRRFIWKVVWGVTWGSIRLVLIVFWFFCPLRFFFGRKKAKQVAKPAGKTGKKAHGVAQ